ncbi:hypothetical protein PSPO01_16616 [Paraphaeosphaeria sporulosa]
MAPHPLPRIATHSSTPSIPSTRQHDNISQCIGIPPTVLFALTAP